MITIKCGALVTDNRPLRLGPIYLGSADVGGPEDRVASRLGSTRIAVQYPIKLLGDTTRNYLGECIDLGLADLLE